MDVVKYPGPALRRGGERIETFDAQVAEIAGKMLQTMYDEGGVGLAAPQVGLPWEMFVMNETGDPAQKDQELVLINPEILTKKGKEWGDEGCLSFPGIYAEVQRSKKITVRYQDLEGTEHEIKVEGFTARVIQHELDHLKGVLFVDRLSSVDKLRVKSQLQDMEQNYAPSQA